MDLPYRVRPTPVTLTRNASVWLNIVLLKSFFLYSVSNDCLLPFQFRKISQWAAASERNRRKNNRQKIQIMQKLSTGSGVVRTSTYRQYRREKQGKETVNLRTKATLAEDIDTGIY